MHAFPVYDTEQVTVCVDEDVAYVEVVVVQDELFWLRCVCREDLVDESFDAGGALLDGWDGVGVVFLLFLGVRVGGVGFVV